MTDVIILLTAALPFVFAAMALLFYRDFIAPRRRQLIRRSDRRARRRRDTIRYQVWKKLRADSRLPRLADQRGMGHEGSE